MKDWDIVVVDHDLTADDTLAAINEYIDPATNQYVLVTFEATYSGTGTGELSDLDWTFVGSDNLVYDEVYAQTAADEKGWPTKARNGGRLRGQVVFDLLAEILAGGTLVVEHSYSEEAIEFHL